MSNPEVFRSDKLVVSVGGKSRFEIEPKDMHLYPTGKEGQTTKVRRYNPTVKVSDMDKIHGKLKGRSRKKIKKDGFPPSYDD